MIVEYESKYENDIKDLLIELQNYIIKIDKYNLNLITEKYRDKYFDNMIDEIVSKNGKIYLSIVNDKVVGFIAGYIEEYNEIDECQYSCPRKGIIAELIVRNESRHNGLGDKLIAQIEEFFKLTRCDYIQLDVFAYNENALDFYKKHDYEERMITLFKQIK